MALSTQTQEWLNGLKAEGSLSDEAFNTLKSSLESNSKADEYVRGSQLRQSDYSKLMTEVQTAKKAVEDSQVALQKREVDVNKFQADLGTWKADADVKFQNAFKEREKASVTAQKALERLRSLAVANGIDEAEVLRDLDVEAPVADDKKKVDIDLSEYLKRSDAQQAMSESAMIDASIHDIAAEYFDLTGKPMRGAAQLVQEALAAKKPLTVFAAEKFKFAELRATAQEASIQKRIDDAVAAKSTEILSNANLGAGAGAGLRTDIHGSPILGREFKAPTSGEQSGENGVSAAVAAFNAGKYKK